MFGDGRKMSVALCCHGLARNGGCPGWDDDGGLRMTFGHSIVDGLAIIRAVGGHRRQVSVNLIEQLWDFGNVADILRCQFHSDDFMRVSINPEMQLAPAAARPDAVFLIQPFALAVDLETGAVDEKMQWLIAVDPLWQDRQTPTPATQGRVIRNCDADPEHGGNRSQH